MGLFETWKVRAKLLSAIDGGLALDPGVRDEMSRAPTDILPDFQAPPGFGASGRGKDHPRYGRFIYAFAKHYRPRLVVEVGTFAGGTAIGWAAALVANGSGRLVCIDNDTYAKGTYPEIARRNITKTGLGEDRFALRCGDSKVVVPEVARELGKEVDVYLVDGDHTYEGATADMESGFPMLRSGGFLLVHDVDRGRRMDEATPEHPHPVYEAFRCFVAKHRMEWCILHRIRKHLGIAKVV